MGEKKRLIVLSVDRLGCVRQEGGTVELRRGRWVRIDDRRAGGTPTGERVDDLGEVHRGAGPCYSVRVLDDPDAGLKLIAEKIASDAGVLRVMADAIERERQPVRPARPVNEGEGR